MSLLRNTQGLDVEHGCIGSKEQGVKRKGDEHSVEDYSSEDEEDSPIDGENSSEDREDSDDRRGFSDYVVDEDSSDEYEPPSNDAGEDINGDSSGYDEDSSGDDEDSSGDDEDSSGDDEDSSDEGENDDGSDDLPPPKSKPQKKTTRPKSLYLQRLYDSIAKLSITKDRTSQNVFQQWRFMDVEDLGEATGQCACGKKNIRYLYYIENRETGKQTCVGSKCIKQFGEDLMTVAKVTRNLLHKGIEGLLIEDGDRDSNVVLEFEISPTSGIVKHQQKFRSSSTSIPLQMPREAGARKPVLTATPAESVAGSSDRLAKMQKGQTYRLRVRLVNEFDKENGGKHLKAEVIHFQHVRKHTPMSSQKRKRTMHLSDSSKEECSNCRRLSLENKQLKEENQKLQVLNVKLQSNLLEKLEDIVGASHRRKI